MSAPVRVRGRPQRRVEALSAELEAAGVRARGRPAAPGDCWVLPPTARPGSATWRRRLPGAEAVVTADEEQREAVEAVHPELIGRVWVWQPGLGAMLADRLRPGGSKVTGRVAVVGYNLKFISRIVEHLRRLPGVEVRVREWPKYAVDDQPEATERVLDWADTVIAEWCGPNAVLASRRTRPGQRLVVRLHRFELERDDWRAVDIEAVDAVVTVGSYYRRKVVEECGWPESKVIEIPNWVDMAQLDRPKLPNVERTLGLLGAIPRRKRLDRALDLLEELRRHDPGFTLRIKTESPWDHRWMREHEDERRYFEAQLDRVERLAAEGAVIVDPGGPDVAAWLRRVGTILSMSDDESFHLAPAEGMASGSVPVIWGWPGAEQVYDPRWVVDTIEAAVEACLQAADPELQPQLRNAARAEVARYDLPAVLDAWEEVL